MSTPIKSINQLNENIEYTIIAILSCFQQCCSVIENNKLSDEEKIKEIKIYINLLKKYNKKRFRIDPDSSYIAPELIFPGEYEASLNLEEVKMHMLQYILRNTTILNLTEE